ncbi:Ankyrin repeat domain-containing protein 13C [Globomyces sp. JEL0801]|nr:Ankyrin repeat domain-containing protein 13C [Globomyces sp. JEL0801]
MDSGILHKLIFKDDHEMLDQEIIANPNKLNELFRGQTPLTLAVQLGRLNCVQILLKHNATTLNTNSAGWSPFHESISYGDRQIMKLLYSSKRHEYSKWVDDKGKAILKELSNDLQDGVMEMNWSFKSFIPFVSSLCPSDTYTIYKKGSNLRIDTTLVGFERLNWIRGNISIVFRGEGEDAKLVIIDHDTKTIQQIWPRDFSITDDAIEEELSNAAPHVQWDYTNISRAKSGFLAFKYDKNEMIEQWPTSVWNVDEFRVQFKTRTEHLNANPLPKFKIMEQKEQEKKAARELKKKQKAAKPKSRFVIANPDVSESDDDDQDAVFTSAEKDEEEKIRNYKPGYRNIQDGDDDKDYKDWRMAKKAFEELAAFRPTLDPPPKPMTSFDEYANGTTDLYLGRQMTVESIDRTYSGKLWMYKPTGDPNTDLGTVPLKASVLFPLLELVGMGNEHIRSFNDFTSQKLPEGFPVQLEIPIGMLPLSAVVKFQHVLNKCDVEDNWFEIPDITDGYRVGEVLQATEE